MVNVRTGQIRARHLAPNSHIQMSVNYLGKKMPDTTIPVTRQAIIQDGFGHGVVATVPMPVIAASEILVRTVAVAINPTDHKMPANFSSPRAIIGCDFAGIVAKVGPGVPENSEIRIGTRVAGAVHGSNPIDHADGAFSEYIKTSADLVFVPPNDMSWEEAAAIGGTGHGSLCLALWGSMGLSGRPKSPTGGEDYVLVYVSACANSVMSDHLTYNAQGGSSATGTMAMQLLKL